MDPSLAITQYARDTWGNDDGLPQASVTAVIQTRDGYLWLGTQEGVARFDGRQFHVFGRFNTDPAKNTVTALHEDRDGVLWVGTRGGGVSTYSNRRFATITTEDGLGDDNVTDLECDRQGSMWVGTLSAGVSRIVGDSITVYGEEHGLPSNNVSKVTTDHEDRVWVATAKGIAYFDGSGFTTAGLPVSSFDVTTITQMDDKSIWVGTRGDGIYVIRGKTISRPRTTPALPEETVRAILEDRAGNIWIGYDRSGLARVSSGRVEILDTDNGLPTRNILSLFEDREGSLWVGTDAGGLVRLRTGRFVTYTTTEGLGDDMIYAVYADEDNVVWVGSEEGGVSRISADGIRTYSVSDGLPSDAVYSISKTADGSMWFGTARGLARMRDGTIEVVETPGSDERTIYGLYTDSLDRLWISTDNVLLRYQRGHFESFGTDEGLSSGVVNVVAENSAGDIWIGTYNGGLNRMRDDVVVEVFDEESGLLSESVTALYPDEKGALWVGVSDGGLTRFAPDGTATAFTTQNGLFDNSVFHIEADGNGAFWMTSNRGLFAVDIKEMEDYARGTRKSVTSRAFSRADGLLTNEFNGGLQPAGARTPDGRLWFPSTRGVVSVDPDNLRRNEVEPLVAIDSVVVDGRSIDNNDIVPPGGRRLDITFAGLSFIAPDRTQYAYQLSGVDDEWHDGGNARTASYTNLRPGRYTFRIRAANADGVWSPVSTFSFELEPLFVQTPLFVATIVLGLILLIAVGHRLRVRRLTQQRGELERTVAERTRDLRIEKERTEEALLATERARAVIEEQADKLREMDRIKSRFFGNISHEFRTPLTLTIGPLENAITGVYGPVSPKLEKQLELMLRNSRRLLRLINQLLDLSKLESGQMSLRPRIGDIEALVEGVVLSFSAFAESENIRLDLNTEDVSGDVVYDTDAIEKVLFNLLSNAVKFTPAGGTVTVNMANDVHKIRDTIREVVAIRVSDTGIGIPASHLPHIFDRFHQVDGSVSRVQEGTGIGLALVRELVELHGGEISVESVLNEGSTFTVFLRKGIDHLGKLDESPFSDENEISYGPMVEMAVFDEEGAERYAPRASDDDERRPTVLVVDDSRDVRRYVVDCLSDRFDIVTATDGLDALSKVRKNQPDMILSDVMMPKMDGYALCRAVKSDEQLAHIPVVMLTSKASVDDRIEGLEAGSDDYLSKPFNARELRTRIDNLLRSRRQTNELHELNRTLSENNDALREASELKTQLLSIASHDMKNPLTAIREFAKIVKSEIGTNSHLNELLDLIYSSSNEMLVLVTQLLDSAALEGGQLQLDLRPVDVSHVAEIVTLRNRAQANAKGQKLTFRPARDEAVVLGDMVRLQEAMDNVVSNAIKYSPFDKPIEVLVERVESNVRFTVRDEGPGLTKDDRKRLFGRFQRLSAQPTGGESSNGLGLSIVKQIVELHGGTVVVESNPGQGATFILEFESCSEKQAAEYHNAA